MTRAHLSDEAIRLQTDAFDQAHDAMVELDRPASHYLVMPWRSLYEITGPIAPGEIWMVCAFSGRGKTTFLTSLVNTWLGMGETVYYMGLESRPKMIRTYFAAYRKGYAPGEILSGTAKLEWPHWPSVRAEVRAELDRMMRLPDDARLHVNGQPRIVAEQLGAAFEEAREVGARLLVLDHIDQVQADRGNAYAVSRAVVDTLEDLAKHYEIPVLVSSQLNNEVLRGDPLAQLRPPMPHHVYQGGHKRFVVTGMLGLYRPVDPQALPEDVKAVKSGEKEPLEIATPGTMGVVCMKHRHFGNREGWKRLLRVERGQVSEMDPRDQYRTGYDDVRRT
ncbi:MAG: hypothetical protein EKK62_17075 [Acidimicrobiia bacterium]|nr:MAG: hypothetical protein EKK62_17075 [Acidimicrobiia bacterium]